MLPPRIFRRGSFRFQSTDRQRSGGDVKNSRAEQPRAPPAAAAVRQVAASCKGIEKHNSQDKAGESVQ